ncbi:MAG: hypothetical protein DMG88_10520 [Acidobacteria bacterium]|nr:MAG: hypothetical protein DMG88_10520 [Acidobacteriota bacterium]
MSPRKTPVEHYCCKIAGYNSWRTWSELCADPFLFGIQPLPSTIAASPLGDSRRSFSGYRAKAKKLAFYGEG